MRTCSLPEDLVALARRQHRFISLDQARDFGVSANRCYSLVDQGRLRRAMRGVFELEADLMTANASQTLDACAYRSQITEQHQRLTVAALLSFGPDAVAVGTAALAIHGTEGLPSTPRPQIALSAGRSGTSRDGVRVRRFDDGMQVTTVNGWRVASPIWALVQAIPEAPRASAISMLDSALNRELILQSSLEAVRHHMHGRRGVAKTHEWWQLVDGRAQSPLETQARLDCFDCGVPPDALQVEVRSRDGELLGYGDMGWRLPDGRWLIVEIDGVEPHSTPNALLRDRRRQNDFLLANAVILRFTAADIRIPGQVGRTIRRYLAAHS